MTEQLSPEERRDAAVSAIHAAGGVVTGAMPLADPSDPHTVVAYEIRAGAPTPDALPGIAAVRADTEHPEADGLIPWSPEPTDEPEMEV